MVRQIVVSSVVAAVVAFAVVLTTRPASVRQPASPAAPPPHDDGAALAALRDELRVLREELAAMRTAPTQAPIVQARNADAPSRARAMTSEQRFATLGKLVSEQARDASWAGQREAEIKALPSRHDYFKQTTFEVVDCRTTMCRVLATFPDESAQGMFDTTFAGFVATFSYALSREVSHDGRPAIETFLSLADPFPR